MNFDYITNASLAIQIHLATALLALGVGIFMWRARKGTRTHKLVGRGFALLMLITAFTTLFIRNINNGSLSWVHLFIILTVAGVWQAVYWIRKGDIVRHKKHIKGLFFGALIIPGLFTFLPGRTMYMLFFGGPYPV